MNKIKLAIVGCGGMGHRHLRGLAELTQACLSPFELIGACDPVTANAESLAQEAEEHFGTRPTIVARQPDVDLGLAAPERAVRCHH